MTDEYFSGNYNEDQLTQPCVCCQGLPGSQIGCDFSDLLKFTKDDFANFSKG